jgi:hypothetical protein
VGAVAAALGALVVMLAGGLGLQAWLARRRERRDDVRAAFERARATAEEGRVELAGEIRRGDEQLEERYREAATRPSGSLGDVLRGLNRSVRKPGKGP